MRTTPVRLERELRRRLSNPKTILRITTLKNETQAWCDWDGEHLEIVLDPYRCGYIEGTVHEVIHKCRAKHLLSWGTLEEDVALAAEARVMNLINTDPKRVRWWREAIAEKLAMDNK